MPATFEDVQPVLSVRDVDAAVAFYGRLGFRVRWRDDRYAVLVRDRATVHVQWHDPKEWEAGVDRPMLRFLVSEVAALFEAYRTLGVFHERTRLEETAWGTEEFAFYDPDRNGLVFFRPR